MHQKNIIHGDLKPRNIFIKGRTIKIGDFGLSEKTNKLISFEKDLFDLGVIVLEIMYPTTTVMERAKMLEKYKQENFKLLQL